MGLSFNAFRSEQNKAVRLTIKEERELSRISIVLDRIIYYLEQVNTKDSSSFVEVFKKVRPIFSQLYKMTRNVGTQQGVLYKLSEGRQSSKFAKRLFKLAKYAVAEVWEAEKELDEERNIGIVYAKLPTLIIKIKKIKVVIENLKRAEYQLEKIERMSARRIDKNSSNSF